MKLLNEDDDVFACLMICLPLIEKHVRYKLRKSGKDDTKSIFSENSPAIHLVAKVFGEVKRPEREPDIKTVYAIWDSFRNGLLHRAAAKPELDYELRPERDGDRVFLRDGARVRVYPFVLRSNVISMLENSPDEMWMADRCPFPEVWHIE